MMGKVLAHFETNVNWSDYIGYKVYFTEAVDLESTVTIVRNLNRLNMGPMRTNHGRKSPPFAPYSAALRLSCKSNITAGATIRSAPVTRQPKLKKSQEPKNNDEEQFAWGTLISKSQGFPNIDLFEASTGLGNFVDFVDSSNGERQFQFSKLSC